MDAERLGQIKAIIGIERDKIDPDQLAGYDACNAERGEDWAAWKAKTDRYNQLAAKGLTDREIERVMTADAC